MCKATLCTEKSAQSTRFSHIQWAPIDALPHNHIKNNSHTIERTNSQLQQFILSGGASISHITAKPSGIITIGAHTYSPAIFT